RCPPSSTSWRGPRDPANGERKVGDRPLSILDSPILICLPGRYDERWDHPGRPIMLELHGKKGARTCDGVSRRDFLQVGSLGGGAVGLSLADLQARGGAGKATNCILLFLVGGPSQLDTWDLKPAAPSAVRGPFQPIKTNVPGVQIGEHFPRMA